MLRIGQYGSRRIIARAACNPQLPSQPGHRFISTANARKDKFNSWTPSPAMFLGAGIVFSGVSLMIQSPSLGLGGRIVQNDSPSNSNDGNKSPSLGARIAGYFIAKPGPVDQKDIKLDTDLTVTSWKQLEQVGLVNTPGVMLWGSNKNGLIDPTGKSPGVISIPQRLQIFQGMVLRDLKLGDDVAAAVDEEGNVYQWGNGYIQGPHQPEVTLKNRNIVSVAISDTMVFGLSKDGNVYVLPKARADTGPSKAAIEYKASSGVWKYVGASNHDQMTKLPVKDVLAKDEIITSIASGKNHLLMVSSKGRVFGSQDGLSISQIGNPEFRQSRILEVACGDVHSLARDDEGRCWAWGVNGFGQLGQGVYSHANLILVHPTLIKDIAGEKCVKVAAGGNTSYVVISENNKFVTKAAGMGQWGQLGNGTFDHIQGTLVTIKMLSGLTEYREADNKLVPVGIHDLAIGSTHAFAVLDNAIVEDGSNEERFSHGRDVLAWGQNTFFQLLTGKRTNKTEPVHALPLDSDILQPADKAISAISNGTPKKDAQKAEASSSLNATNRLQLPPSQPRVTSDNRDTKNPKLGAGMVELKITAGVGISAVYSKSI
ncbi:hypothetical protein BGZ76_009868 [Entomortierella beljakovae]|nr:hypothetical protein BGZ76_009868 [Entomortierella beljakovae]